MKKFNKIATLIAYNKLQSMLKEQGVMIDRAGVVNTNWRDTIKDYEHGIDDRSIKIYKEIRAFGINKKILTSDKLIKTTQEKYNFFSKEYL